MFDPTAYPVAGTIPPSSVSAPPHPPPDFLPEAVRRLVAGPVGAAIADAVGYSHAALAPATRAAYERDWDGFRIWCAEHGAAALPAAPALVAGYLATRAGTLGRSGLRRCLAGIAHEHRRFGQPWTSNHPVVAATVRGILRRHGIPARPAAALGSDEVKTLLSTCATDAAGPGGMAGLRDQALLLVGLAGALRRSELVALEVDDLRFTREGLVLRIRRSKRDPEGEGADVGVTPGQHPETCPVRALKTWLRESRTTGGPVFRAVSATGGLGRGLTANGVWKILRRRAALAGLVVHPGERLSPHGLRAGFITESYLNGALDEQVAHHARHKDLATTRSYRHRAKTLVASPAKLLNL